MEPITITARRLLTDIGSVEYPVLSVDADGRLADISSDPRALAAATDTLTAAFLDVHTHGALGHDVMSASPAELGEMNRFLDRCGVAHYLPTTVTTGVEQTLAALTALADAVEAPRSEHQAQPIGIHLEGPFLSHTKRGVHTAADLLSPDVALFDRFMEAARGHILLVTLAPELPGALNLIEHARASGVRVSLGHSDATAAQAQAAVAAGATSATHTFNAMRALDHREPGVLGVVLDDPRLYAELICDGIHVAPALVRLWLRAKAPDRALLVTDAMSATGMPDGRYKLGTLDVEVADGCALLAEDLRSGRRTLAGSVLTMDAAVDRLQRYTGASLAEATRLATHNPAAMLGRPELTRLAPGSPANLNRFSSEGRLLGTYLNGREVPRSG